MITRSSHLRLSALVLLGLMAACSATADSRFSRGTAGSGASTASGSLDISASSGNTGGFASNGPSTTSTGSGNGECSEASKLVYVVGTGNQLYSFTPPTHHFNEIGEINCVAQGGFGSPFSMAVARDGTAYVLFDDRKLFAIDTSTAACKSTSFVPNQIPGFDLFGMGFATDPGDSSSETLYVASFYGDGLGKIDLETMKLSFIGPYDLLADPAELTGTGDGRLFGFFLTTPVKVAEVAPSSAKILSVAPQPSVDIGGGWAFAFWGGDFWLFTSPNSFTSQVDQYQPSTQTTTKVAEVGFKIVGAGVSTCAPVDVPK